MSCMRDTLGLEKILSLFLTIKLVFSQLGNMLKNDALSFAVKNCKHFFQPKTLYSMPSKKEQNDVVPLKQKISNRETREL